MKNISQAQCLDELNALVGLESWSELLRRAGFEAGGALWIHPARVGHVKLEHRRGRPGHVAFLNGTDGRGPPRDAVHFARDAWGLTWDDAQRFVRELVDATEGKDEEPSGAPTAMPSPEVATVAERMRVAGLGFDADGAAHLNFFQCPLGQSLLIQLRATTGPEGRIHPRWVPGHQESGRWGCEPYLFDVPHEARRVIGAGEGRVFVEADLCAAGLVALAALTADPLLRWVAGQPDPYAALFGHIAGRSPTPAERETTKNLFQRASHGAASSGFVPGTVESRVFEVSAGVVRPLHEWVASELSRVGGVTEPVSGRVFRQTGVGTKRVVALLEQALVAHHVDRALVRANAELRRLGAEVVAMWHDSVIAEAPISVADEVAARVESALRSPVAFPFWSFAFNTKTRIGPTL